MTTMTSRVRSINPLQLGLILGIIYALLGILAAIFFMSFGGMMMALAPMYGRGFGGFGAFSLIIFPVMYFVGGFLSGLIVGALYNLVAGWIGGVEITLDTAV
ncbi:MAG TPA: hypothetical protein VIJ64_02325 [Candidatus Lustribacter sp.]